MIDSNFLLLEFLLTISSNAYYHPRFVLPVFAVDTMYNRVSNLVLDVNSPHLFHGKNFSISVVK